MKQYPCRRVFCTAAFFLGLILSAWRGVVGEGRVISAGVSLDALFAERLMTAWLCGEEVVWLDEPLPLSVVEETYFALRNAYPAYFWVGYRFVYTMDTSRALVQSVSPIYLCEADAITALSAVYEAKLNALVSLVSPGGDDVDVARLLHDALADAVTYGQASASLLGVEGKYTAYGALVDGAAVCRGYAMAYLDLLRRCGIEGVYVRSEEMNHGWVKACLDGEWVHIDVAWDDGDAIDHRYFARSDLAMRWLGYGDWSVCAQ